MGLKNLSEMTDSEVISELSTFGISTKTRVVALVPDLTTGMFEGIREFYTEVDIRDALRHARNRVRVAKDPFSD
jgi:hypothetical protein